MNIPTYHIDAFTSHLFSGNPAMVCILEYWLPDATLLKIAEENNLPVTAFLVQKEEVYSIRWFTPEDELDLCGHGTLAAAYVIFNLLKPSLQKITFQFPNGTLQSKRNGEYIILDFPVISIEHSSSHTLVNQGLGITPHETYQDKTGRSLVVFDSEEKIEHLKPDMQILKQSDYRCIIVTAPGKTSDFVSRVFYPKKTMTEDAVTGSSHCLLVPYWANQLNKRELQSRQLSQRGGELACELDDDRVIMCAKAVLYMQGIITV